MTTTSTSAGHESLAKQALEKWPRSSTSLWTPSRPGGAWLKAQPPDGETTGPRLIAAGTDTLRIQPDGLWVFLSFEDSFADCVAIEACTNALHFADKRSRYQPSTTARVLHCPVEWLNGSIRIGSGNRERWRLAHGAQGVPTEDVRFPARSIRVLFFLANELYEEIRNEGIPEPHEFIASYSSIGSYTSQAMQGFLRRMSPDHHFYTK